MQTNDKKHEMDDDKMNESQPGEYKSLPNEVPGISYHNSDLSDEDSQELLKELAENTKPVVINFEGKRGEIHDLNDFVGECDTTDQGGGKGLIIDTSIIPEGKDKDAAIKEVSGAKTIEEVQSIMDGWKEETKIPEPEKKAVKPFSRIDPKDVEKHGFKLQPRGKSTDPFTYRKWFVILETPGQSYSWEEEGYCLQLTMLMPDGRTFINVLGPEHVYLPEKCDMSICPCHFDGIVYTSEELDNVIEMTMKRNPTFIFDPVEEVPHQNFWVELARNQVNTKPVKN